MKNNYDDIINLPRWNPKKHPRMSMESRNAQFAPFAALTGYEDGVNEYPETSKTREVVVSNLNEARAKIQEKTEKYFELIDDAIKKFHKKNT